MGLQTNRRGDTAPSTRVSMQQESAKSNQNCGLFDKIP